jgi:hypothetical protein
MTPRQQAEEFSDTASGELSAVRSLFGAIAAGIRATAPRSALRGLLATMRDQQRATEAEIIMRGQRRRQWLQEFARAARAVLAQQERGAQRPAPRHWRVTLRRRAAR